MTAFKRPEGFGGTGRGQGRKALKAGEWSIVVSLRMTPEQRERLRKLGGGAWVRAQIDKTATSDSA